MALELTLKFTFRNETKGCWRYEEVASQTEKEDLPVVGALYVKKYAVKGERPENLTVVIKGE